MSLKITQAKLISLALGAVLLCVLIITVYVVVKNNQAVKSETRQIFAGSTSTSPTYTDIQGNKLSLEEWLGNPIVVVSWASWSPFSADNLTTLNDLAGEFKSQPVKFMAINRKESNNQALRYLSTLQPLPNITIVIDTEDLFYTKINGYAMPETLIFDAKGDIILHERGQVSIDDIRQTLDQLFKN